MKNNFSHNIISLIILSFYRSSSQEFNLTTREGVLSLGIVWSCLKHLIVITGITLIFSVGLRGSGVRVEYLFFNLLLWFYFADVVNTTLAQQYNKAVLSQKGINSFIYFFAHISRITLQFFVLLILSFLFFYLFNFEIYYNKIIESFIFIGLIALIYATTVSSLLHKKTFLIELHGFGMQALFFASASIIPISIVPSPFRDYLLYIPIVHIQESIKSDITGIQLSYIDINYPITFIVFGIFLVLPALHYKNNRFSGA